MTANHVLAVAFFGALLFGVAGMVVIRNLTKKGWRVKVGVK